MKIKALVPFSNGTLSMEQYEVREVTDSLGNELIAAGVAVEIGGGSGGGVLVVTDTDGTLDKTWQEIKDADFAVVKKLGVNGYESGCVTSVVKLMTYYDVNAFEWVPDPQAHESVAREKTYRASSADGYPTLVE